MSASNRKDRPFRFSICPSSRHKDHLIVEVDSLTGEVTLGPPLAADELIAISSQGFPAKLPPVAVTQLIAILFDQVVRLRRELEALRG